MVKKAVPMNLLDLPNPGKWEPDGRSFEHQVDACKICSHPKRGLIEDLITAGTTGKNIAKWLSEGKLPNTVGQFGSTPEEIFVCYEEVKDLVGADEMKNLPLGALGVYSYSEKIRVGLQQLMAGARCFSVPAISRNELMSLTEECASVTGIPYLMDAYRKEAMEVLYGADYTPALSNIL